MNKGFTLIELLIVISITSILVVAATPIYSNLQATAQLNESSSQMVQVLRTAQQRARVRKNNAAHGVFLLQATADTYVLFQGDSYASRDTAYDRALTLDSGINVLTTLPSNEVVFAAGTGVPSATGTLTLTQITEGSRTIYINEIGSIEEQ